MVERKIVITKSDNADFPYNAQVWNFINGKWWYGGSGRFCKTIEEALKYASDHNLTVEFN